MLQQRAWLLNANGTHILPSNADDAKVIINGQALRDKFRSLVEDLMPTLDLRYRWGIAMSRHYWIEYHTVGAASHVLSKKETIASTSHVRSKKKPIASTSHVLSKKTGPIPSTDKKTAHMTDTVADSRSKKNGGMKLPKNKVGDGNDQLKAGNHVVGSSSDGAMSRFSNGGDVAGSCLPRGDVLVSHTRGGAGGDEGFEVLTAPKSLISQNNQYYMRMEGDCRLVLYRTASGETLWSSAITVPSHQTLPKEYSQLSCSLSLLSDGTLVITDGSDPDGGAVVWSSRSSSASSENPSYCPSIFIFILQDDGNAVVYNMLSGLPIWATGTNR